MRSAASTPVRPVSSCIRLGEGFALDDRGLDDVFALADEQAGR
jgi:hypothetical protein